MKRLKKLSASIALTACLMAFGASSASAATGWADTMDTAELMYFPGGGGSFSASVPLDSPTDNDWYVINNSSGSEHFSYYVILTPPSWIDLKFQIVRTDANNNITYTDVINHNGPGYAESIGWDVKPYEKVFFRVMPVGQNDYDTSTPYSIEFRKTS